MSTTMWNLVKASPAILGTSLVMASAAVANESNVEVLRQINRYNQNSNSLDQVTNVNQLRDVSPGDWAYEALRNLVETYGCIAGYPDGTYRGNRAMTRYEFAAGLNACLQQIERLIAASTADFVTKDDLATLQRLMEEFEAELATLGTRVDNLEGRVAFLEDNQFSTTTKLKGEVIFSLNGAFGDDVDDDQITFSDRVRLALDTSFTGKDRLRTRLEAGNIPRLDTATGTRSARLGYDANNGNNIDLESLWYRFPVNDNIRAWVGAASLDANDVAGNNINNPFFASSGTGALSRFARRNPAVYRINSGTGAAVNINFGGFGVDLAYLTDDGNASNPADGNGLFNGDSNYMVQLNLEPFEDLNLSATYVRSHLTAGNIDLSGSTSSGAARRPFGNGVAHNADRFGIQANYRLSEGINFGGWVGYVSAEALEDPNPLDNVEDPEDYSADIWNWALHLAFPDLGGEGNVLGFIFGMPPKATDVDNAAEDEDTSFLLEANYKLKLSSNIQVTPGIYVIFNPDHNDDNDTVYVGTIRTTFKF